MKINGRIREFAGAEKDGALIYNGDCLKLLEILPDASIDLVVTSPPYCIGMEYEREKTVGDFVEAHKKILPEIVRVVKPGGSICWQVGFHVSKSVAYPLDYAVFSILESVKEVSLRNRIIWSFGHGLHTSKRFSGRHETILWFTKGADYFFDLDAVRVLRSIRENGTIKGRRKGSLVVTRSGRIRATFGKSLTLKAIISRKQDIPVSSQLH